MQSRHRGCRGAHRRDPGGLFLRRRRPPTPVVMIGKTPGWTKEVLDVWDAGLKKTPGRVPGSQHPRKKKED